MQHNPQISVLQHESQSSTDEIGNLLDTFGLVRRNENSIQKDTERSDQTWVRLMQLLPDLLGKRQNSATLAFEFPTGLPMINNAERDFLQE